MPQSLELACKLSHRLDQFQPEAYAVWCHDSHHTLDGHVASHGACLRNYNTLRAHAKQLRRELSTLLRLGLRY